MPFKLNKDHVGKKVRSIHWSKDDFGFPLYVSDTWVVFKDKWGGEDVCSVDESTAWEFYEEPTPDLVWKNNNKNWAVGTKAPSQELHIKTEVWWEEGKVYRDKKGGQYYKFKKNDDGRFQYWAESFPNLFDSKQPYWMIYHGGRPHQEDFEEIGIHKVPYGMSPQQLLESLKIKKTIRMAPALVKYDNANHYLTGRLYSSLKEAKDYNSEDIFIQWPASDNLWVEVPVEEGSE